MRNIEPYLGVIPAFYACYDTNGKISPEAVEALTHYYVEKGVKGVYVNGSSGECIYLSVEERKLVLEHVVRAAQGRLTIIAHVACNCTQDSQMLAAHAESLGVHAIAAIPPIYFHLTEKAIAQYWNSISAAAPNTDFIIYNIPQLAGVTLTLPLFRKMLDNPRLIGVKNSSLSVQDIPLFQKEGSQGDRPFVVFNGPDEQFLAGRVMGARSGIGGTYGVMPELFEKLDRLITQNNWKAAQTLQLQINQIIRALQSLEGDLYAAAKAVIRLRTGLELGGVRPPLLNLAPQDAPAIEQVAAMIQAAIQTNC